MNTQQLLDYLNHYRGGSDLNKMFNNIRAEDLQEEFEAFSVFRLHPNAVDYNIRNTKQRREDKKRERKAAIERGEYVGKPRRSKTRDEKMATMSRKNADKFLAKQAAKMKLVRKEIARDPVKSAEYKAKARARAKASRDNKRNK